MRRLTGLVVVFLLGGCSALLNLGDLQGGDAGDGLSDGDVPLVDAAPVDAGFDASSPDAGPFDASSPDAGPFDASLPDAGPCTPGVSCVDNPGAPCTRGEIRCDAGAPVCVDTMPADDGTTCDAEMACVLGECQGRTVISSATDLSAGSTTGGTCADGATYAVRGFGGPRAITLQDVPGACLAAGDEVLLINLQGAPGATANVGSWELLRVTGVSGVTVMVSSDRTRAYGRAAGSDDDIGADPGQQRVALVRVPRYGELAIGAGATLTANPFDGQIGGVVALRAGTLVVNGTITAAGLGYRSGRGSVDTSCFGTVTTESGESISGPGSQTTSRNLGGPGGAAGLLSSDFNGMNSVAATPGHSRPGEPGAGGTRTLGEPGLAYGVADGTRLTMGSGAAGGYGCGLPGLPEPVLVTERDATTAGGIILLLVGEITVGVGGSISASANPSGPRGSDGRVAAAGGYVSIVGRVVPADLSGISARGATATVTNTGGATFTNSASAGYISVRQPGTLCTTGADGVYRCVSDSCESVRDRLILEGAALVDGVFELDPDLDGAASTSFTVYCADLASAPRAYLDVDPDHNFSSNKEHDGCSCDQYRREWTRLRLIVDASADPVRFSVQADDRTFSRVRGFLRDGTEDTTCVTSPPPRMMDSCIGYVDPAVAPIGHSWTGVVSCGYGTLGHGEYSLAGTAFRFPARTPLEVGTVSAVSGVRDQTATLNAARSQLSTTFNASCGAWGHSSLGGDRRVPIELRR